MKPVILLELNEISFDLIRTYVRSGLLSNFARLIARHGVSETTSEQRYEELEPWIQWVTAHTGLTLKEHGIFRLGDIVSSDIPQIWEQLEAKGYKVGAVSPMNAKNRTRAAAFFVPDPWTPTTVTAPYVVRKMYRAISEVVNNHAQVHLTARSACWLALGTVLNARLQNYGLYIRLALGALRKPWMRAGFLDLLLSDLFIRQVKRARPQFASLFVNAGAHIQHHYMFCSRAYSGERRNPEWYVGRNEDPLLDIYSVYDRIVGQVESALSGYRLMIATGLHQEPHEAVTFYWRLKDHNHFLRRIGVPHQGVQTRMSRDFLVFCSCSEEASRAEHILSSVTARDGMRMFAVDNRGSDLFVMLTYPHDITPDFEILVGNQTFGNIRGEVVFVALKNGEHDGVGYFMDTGSSAVHPADCFPLKQLPSKIMNALVT
jgi:hypothetical protein